MLQWSYENADGMVIWTYPMVRYRTVWDENAGWWAKTKEFLARHNIGSAGGE
jgi:hypothetical protein